MPTFLNAIKRRPKQETKGNIPDDGFNEKSTANSMLLKDPQTQRQPVKAVPLMLNKENFYE